MFKKIQKHLLIRHPLIWNTRLIPMLVVLFLVHLSLFFIGYFVTHVTFDVSLYSYDYQINQIKWLYWVCLLISIFLTIGWLYSYNKNNAFKAFYPQKTRTIYAEWLQILILSMGLSILPITLTIGGVMRWQSVATQTEASEVLDMLEVVKMLLPETESYYYYDDQFRMIPVEEADSVFNLPETRGDPALNSFLDEKIKVFNYSVQENGYQLVFTGYKGPSLLYYRENMKNSPTATKRIQLLKKWLATGEKDRIYEVMDELYKLHEKHGLDYTLSKEQWFKKIYQPPYFPVESNMFELGWYYTKNQNEKPCLYINELIASYEEVLKSYSAWERLEEIGLLCLYAALILSFFVFSFRISDGKSWLVAFILSGVCFLITVLSIIASADNSFFISAFLILFLWIALFIILLFLLLYKIHWNHYKGKSRTYINLFLWLIPFLIPLLILEYNLYLKIIDKNSYLFKESLVFWGLKINLAIITLVMYPIASLIRKWKNMPDE